MKEIYKTRSKKRGKIECCRFHHNKAVFLLLASNQTDVFQCRQNRPHLIENELVKAIITQLPASVKRGP
jgi:hypothetical protein